MMVLLVVILVAILIALPFGVWMAFARRRAGAEPMIPACTGPTATSCTSSPPTCDQTRTSRAGMARGHAAGARNCLFVAVGQGELWIKPVFPLKLLAPPGDLGLDVHLPKSAVTSARTEPGLPFGTKVVLQLPAADGATKTVDLFLKSPDAFLAALRT